MSENEYVHRALSAEQNLRRVAHERDVLAAALAQAQARLTELAAMRPATMRQALLLLTNGFKYSTEVVTIARNALATASETGAKSKGPTDFPDPYPDVP
jgi:hypothetical protein